MKVFSLLLLYFVPTVNSQYLLTDAVGLGKRFDGIGALSAGASSKLLISYSEPQRSQILDFLFKPQYGAALQILKVEIGGDGQSTEGSESSHMHEANEENYNRGYEWWLMKEAKKRNTNIAIGGLPWSFPGWVGDYDPSPNSSPYNNVTKAALYIMKWIKGARDVHNVTVDYIGIWNERGWNNDYILELRKTLNNNGLQSTKIIVPDKWHPTSSDYDSLTQNATILNALYAIGAHYSGLRMPENARLGSLPLWSSEDYSTSNDNIGAGCWARLLNENYVYGNITSTIAWNIITSYYAGLPYERNGLMDALQPWSGNYVVQNPIWVTAHTTHFTSVGWNYLKQDYGSGVLSNGGSYVSLTNGTDLTIIIETMTSDHSECNYGYHDYNISSQYANFTLSGSFATILQLYLYTSRFYFDGQSSQVFERQADVSVINSVVTLFLEVDAVYTLSTVYSAGRTQPDSIPSAAPFPLPYTENFESYNADEEPIYLSQQNGAWEIVKTQTESFVRQKIFNRPVEWCGLPGTSAIIGDNSWQDVAMTIRVRSPAVSGSRNIFIALRMAGLGCDTYKTTALFLWLNPNTTVYWISYDIFSQNVTQSGNLSTPLFFDTWHTVSMSVMGSNLSVQVNLDRFSVQVSNVSNITTGGFIGIGSSDFGISDWDDLTITATSPTTTSTSATTPTTTSTPSSSKRTLFDDQRLLFISTIVVILTQIICTNIH